MDREVVWSLRATADLESIVEYIFRYSGSRKEAGQAIGRSGDEGIDGIINEDRLGLDVIYIQAKRWQATIGRPEIQKFAGALQGHRARKEFSSPHPTSVARLKIMLQKSIPRSCS